MNAVSNSTRILLVSLGSRCCAFALEHVVETMRPLPTVPIQNTPSFIRGLATIRGSPVPVVDLGVLFGGDCNEPAKRFVLLRLGERRAAIAVQEVLGIRHLDNTALQNFPPLLKDAFAQFVSAIEIRDQQLLFVLQAARIIPDEVWPMIESSEVTP